MNTGVRIFNVDEVSSYIQDLFNTDPLLEDIWVSGEVSNARRSANGHWYFTLKSASSQLRCALFKNTLPLINHKPSDGDAVLTNGRISSYPAFGQYQLYVDQILAAGEGLLQLKLQELKQKLEQEGLFDASRKRAIPEYPRRIAVITSPTGSVWHDIQDILRRRYPLGELILAPAIVQGDSSPASVIAALEKVADDGRAEVVIIARGGGSIEDLWAFNDERVLRAVYRCPIPVVSAIGHETDTTLCDLVADLRAPTPSAAAELVAPHIREYVQHLRAQMDTLDTLVWSRFSRERGELQTLRQRFSRFDPQWSLQQERMRLDQLTDELRRAFDITMRDYRGDLRGFERQLSLLNPRDLLARGYALVTDPETGKRVRGASELSNGTSLRLSFHDGAARVSVDEIDLRNGKESMNE
ncbi:MAG: exodeoxyribonuclease VII large subunit [Thermomicrobiaceae bacterium]